MRIIFQDGGVAELTNVDKIVVYNPGEVRILKEAIGKYYISDLEYQLGIKEDSDEHSSYQESGDGSISQCDMASESAQHAGQTGVCDISISGGESQTS